MAWGLTETLTIRLSLPLGRPNTATPALRTSPVTCLVANVAKPAGDLAPASVPGHSCTMKPTVGSSICRAIKVVEYNKGFIVSRLQPMTERGQYEGAHVLKPDKGVYRDHCGEFPVIPPCGRPQRVTGVVRRRLSTMYMEGVRTCGVKPSADVGSGGGGGSERHRLSGRCTLANWPGRVDAQKKSSVDPASFHRSRMSTGKDQAFRCPVQFGPIQAVTLALTVRRSLVTPSTLTPEKCRNDHCNSFVRYPNVRAFCSMMTQQQQQQQQQTQTQAIALHIGGRRG